MSDICWCHFAISLGSFPSKPNKELKKPQTNENVTSCANANASSHVYIFHSSAVVGKGCFSPMDQNQMPNTSPAPLRKTPQALEALSQGTQLSSDIFACFWRGTVGGLCHTSTLQGALLNTGSVCPTAMRSSNCQNSVGDGPINMLSSPFA